MDDIFAIDPGHPSLPGHFPGQPIVPGVVLLEQALERLAPQHPALSWRSFTQIKFLHPVKAGQPLTVRLDEAAGRHRRLTVLHGETAILEALLGIEPLAAVP